jgi:hypothetical protein
MTTVIDDEPELVHDADIVLNVPRVVSATELDEPENVLVLKPLTLGTVNVAEATLFELSVAVIVWVPAAAELGIVMETTNVPETVFVVNVAGVVVRVAPSKAMIMALFAVNAVGKPPVIVTPLPAAPVVVLSEMLGAWTVKVAAGAVFTESVTVTVFAPTVAVIGTVILLPAAMLPSVPVVPPAVQLSRVPPKSSERLELAAKPPPLTVTLAPFSPVDGEGVLMHGVTVRLADAECPCASVTVRV